MYRFRFITFVAGFVLLSGCCGSSGDENPGGWSDLTPGPDLAGWRILNGQAEFQVEGGTVIGTTVPGTPNSFLATEAIYSDFELEFEFLVDPEINSGVQIRSLSTADYMQGRVHGYQVEIDPSDRAWTAGIYDEARRKWLFPMAPNPAAQKAFRQGEWNHIRVVCLGSEIATWLNEVPASYLIDDMTGEGFIALQVHSIDDPEMAGKEVRWRNLRIRTIGIEPPAGDFPFVVNLTPNTLSGLEKELGWRLAWDGTTTAGWRGAHRADFPETGWSIHDGVLNVEESGGGEARHGGDIVTVDEFSAFEFQLEFRITEGSNSGIKYFVTEEYDPGGGSAIGLEYQILDDEHHPDAKNGRDGNRTLASLYDLVTAEKQPRYVKEPGEWQHARVVVHPDNTVEHWLNHVQVLTYTRGSDEFLDLVAISKYKDWGGFGLWERGHLLLQDHGNEVSFRSIKVRNLEEEDG
jgi:hypothetical protein